MWGNSRRSSRELNSNEQVAWWCFYHATDLIRCVLPLFAASPHTWTARRFLSTESPTALFIWERTWPNCPDSLLRWCLKTALLRRVKLACENYPELYSGSSFHLISNSLHYLPTNNCPLTLSFCSCLILPVCFPTLPFWIWLPDWLHISWTLSKYAKQASLLSVLLLLCCCAFEPRQATRHQAEPWQGLLCMAPLRPGCVDWNTLYTPYGFWITTVMPRRHGDLNSVSLHRVSEGFNKLFKTF